MPLLFTDTRFLDHDTGKNHPETAERLRKLFAFPAYQTWVTHYQKMDFQLLPIDQLLMVHDKEVGELVRKASANGGGQIEADTVVSPKSFDVGLLAAGAVTAAVDAVLKPDAKDTRAFCIARPPGHHATPTSVMGFCLFNNIALAARHAQKKHGLGKVLIVDWDVHHGNGTQDAFYDDPSVYFMSIHRHPFYPGTGLANETGTGKGLGFTKNLPVPFGISRKEFFDLFGKTLHSIADSFKPELVLISAGFDAFKADPVGGLCLEPEDFTTLTHLVLDVAKTHTKGRVVSALEGGYHLEKLPECVVAHMEGLNRK